jgi:hypothetical protein
MLVTLIHDRIDIKGVRAQGLLMDFFTIVRDYAQTITAAGVIGALFISISGFLFQRRHSNYQRLIEVYKLVNDFEQREARKSVYEAFRIYMKHYYKDGLKIGGKTYWAENLNNLKGNAFLDIFRDPVVLNEMNIKESELQQEVESVRATFDEIGAMFASNLVPKKALLKALWGTGRVCWICLAQNILIERDKRATEFYMNNFQDLFNEIEKYRLKHKPTLPPVEP